jgi:hypothetical protein
MLNSTMFLTNIRQVGVKIGHNETNLALRFDFHDILFLDIDYLI